MNRLNIVLVEPQIPQNTGNISRTCAVTGAALHLVKPYGFEISDKKLKRAGLDYWDKLEIYEYDNIDDFFSKNSGEFYFFTTKGRMVHSDVDYPQDREVYIFFVDKTRKYSPLAQSVEHSAVNRSVTGSSPVGGAIEKGDTEGYLLFLSSTEKKL